jgi:hypothetical protein
MRPWVRIAAAFVAVALLSTDVVISICQIGCDRPARPVAATAETGLCHDTAVADAAASLSDLPRCCHQTPELAAAGLPVIRTTTTIDLQWAAAPAAPTLGSEHLIVPFDLSSYLTLAPLGPSRASSVPLRL